MALSESSDLEMKRGPGKPFLTCSVRQPTLMPALLGFQGHPENRPTPLKWTVQGGREDTMQERGPGRSGCRQLAEWPEQEQAVREGFPRRQHWGPTSQVHRCVRAGDLLCQ